MTPSSSGTALSRSMTWRDPELKDSAKKYELGEPSYLSTVGTKAAIEMLL